MLLVLYLSQITKVFSMLNKNLTDTTSTKNQISKRRYFSLALSNDVYHKTDWYYTGGLHIDYVTESLHNSPLKILLIAFSKNAINEYGISFSIDAFTPVDIKRKEIVENDRPYAGYIMAGNFVISTQMAKAKRLISTLNIGLIGPESQTKDIQKRIHTLLHCKLPQGWNNQIKRDIIIDYSLEIEKAFRPPINYIELIAQANLRVGTLYNNVGIGGKIRVGKMNGYFTNLLPNTDSKKLLYQRNKVQVYGYLQINSKLSVYNTTLQGGFLNKNSPHILSQKQVEKLLIEWKRGLVCGFDTINLEVGEANLSKEFKAGKRHRWGYLTLTILF